MVDPIHCSLFSSHLGITFTRAVFPNSTSHFPVSILKVVVLPAPLTPAKLEGHNYITCNKLAPSSPKHFPWLTPKVSWFSKQNEKTHQITSCRVLFINMIVTATHEYRDFSTSQFHVSVMQFNLSWTWANGPTSQLDWIIWAVTANLPQLFCKLKQVNLKRKYCKI